MFPRTFSIEVTSPEPAMTSSGDDGGSDSLVSSPYDDRRDSPLSDVGSPTSSLPNISREASLDIDVEETVQGDTEFQGEGYFSLTKGREFDSKAHISIIIITYSNLLSEYLRDALKRLKSFV